MRVTSKEVGIVNGGGRVVDEAPGSSMAGVLELMFSTRETPDGG